MMKRLVPIVLVVDRDAVARAIVAKHLKACGCSVVAIADVCDALETFNAHHVDIALVMAAARLPRMNVLSVQESFVFLREVRATDPEVPVILLTDSDDMDIASYRELRIAGALRKPVNGVDLIALVRATLQPAAAVAGRALASGAGASRAIGSGATTSGAGGFATEARTDGWRVPMDGPVPAAAHLRSDARQAHGPHQADAIQQARQQAYAMQQARAVHQSRAAVPVVRDSRPSYARREVAPSGFSWPPRPEDLDSIEVVDARTWQTVTMDLVVPVPVPLVDGVLAPPSMAMLGDVGPVDGDELLVAPRYVPPLAGGGGDTLRPRHAEPPRASRLARVAAHAGPAALRMRGIASRVPVLAAGLRVTASCVPMLAWRVRGMASPVPALASGVRGMVSRVPALASAVRGMASRVPALASDVRGMASRVPALASGVRGMVPRVRAFAPGVPTFVVGAPMVAARLRSFGAGLSTVAGPSRIAATRLRVEAASAAEAVGAAARRADARVTARANAAVVRLQQIAATLQPRVTARVDAAVAWLQLQTAHARRPQWREPRAWPTVRLGYPARLVGATVASVCAIVVTTWSEWREHEQRATDTARHRIEASARTDADAPRVATVPAAEILGPVRLIGGDRVGLEPQIRIRDAVIERNRLDRSELARNGRARRGPGLRTDAAARMARLDRRTSASGSALARAARGRPAAAGSNITGSRIGSSESGGSNGPGRSGSSASTGSSPSPATPATFAARSSTAVANGASASAEPARRNGAAGAADASSRSRGASARGDERRIYATLEQYERAYERLDANAAHAVWPSLNTRALARAFGGLKAQELEFARCNLNVGGENATAVCGGRATYVPRVGNQAKRTEPREWTFRLKKTDENWLIVKAEAR